MYNNLIGHINNKVNGIFISFQKKEQKKEHAITCLHYSWLQYICWFLLLCLRISNYNNYIYWLKYQLSSLKDYCLQLLGFFINICRKKNWCRWKRQGVLGHYENWLKQTKQWETQTQKALYTLSCIISGVFGPWSLTWVPMT